MRATANREKFGLGCAFIFNAAAKIGGQKEVAAKQLDVKKTHACQAALCQVAGGAKQRETQSLEQATVDANLWR